MKKYHITNRIYYIDEMNSNSRYVWNINLLSQRYHHLINILSIILKINNQQIYWILLNALEWNVNKYFNKIWYWTIKNGTKMHNIADMQSMLLLDTYQKLCIEKKINIILFVYCRMYQCIAWIIKTPFIFIFSIVFQYTFKL